MAGNEKRLNKAALIIGADWDTEADINASLMGITPDNPGVIKLNYPPIEVDEIHNANETDVEHANFGPSDFSLDFSKLNFDGNELKLLAGVFGADAVQPLFVVVAGTNDDLDFDDTASAPMSCAIAAGSYTGAELAVLVAAGMNGCTEVAGTYTCAFSTSTLKFTIAESGGPSNFELSWQSGANTLTNIGTLLGFSITADDTGAATYTGDTACDGSGAYQHTLTIEDVTDDIFFTYGVEKGTKIHVVPSLKPLKATFSLNAGLIKLSIGCRGTKVIDDSAIVTGMTSVTYPAIHNSTRAKYGQAVFEMNAQDGDALDTDDIIKPKDFTLEIDRKMDTEHGPGSYTIMEPRSNGKPAVKLTQNFAHLDAVNELYFANWTAQEEKKENITITGPVIVGTFAYSVSLDLPRLHIEDDELPDAQIIPNKLVMRSLVADSAPTGMTVTKPLTCIIVNTRATSLLV